MKDTTQNPTVSVVIPAYNAADTIGRALDSVYAQTYENIIEVIVVDDGSTDTTAAIIRRKYPEVTLIQQENAGPAAARNCGVSASAGQYIAFIDADDYWVPDKIQLQVGVMQRHPGFSLLTCEYVDSRLSLAPQDAQGTVVVHQISFVDWFHGHEWKWNTTSCCSGWLVTSAMFRKAGGLATSLSRSEDVAFLLRLTGLGFSVGTVRRPLYFYHFSRGSASNSPQGRLTNSDLIPRIKAQYDPASEGWAAELLTEHEYAQTMASMRFRLGWDLWDADLRNEAREQFLLAIGAAREAGTLTWRHRAAVIAPRIYRWVSRYLRRRSRGDLPSRAMSD